MKKFFASQGKPWRFVKDGKDFVKDYFGYPQRVLLDSVGTLTVSRLNDNHNIKSTPIVERKLEEWIAPEDLFSEIKRDWSDGEEILVMFDDIAHDMEYKMMEKKGKLTMKTNLPFEKKRSDKEFDEYYEDWNNY